LAKLNSESYDEMKNLFKELKICHEKLIYRDDTRKANAKLYILAKKASLLSVHDKKLKDEALKHALDALSIHESIFDSDSPRFGEICLEIAYYYEQCSDYKNTEIYLNKSIIIMQKFNALKEFLAYSYYDKIADIYFFLGEYQKALEYYEKNKTSIDKKPQEAAINSVFVNECLLNQISQSKNKLCKLKEATDKMNEALLCRESGDEKKALKYRLEALNSFEKCYDNPNRVEKFECYDKIAESYEILSKLEKDEQLRKAYEKLAVENRNKSKEMKQRLDNNFQIELNETD
jgi:tetratricopeptide (TPR) repeat protein